MQLADDAAIADPLDLEVYLGQLYTLMLAHAIAGCKSISSDPITRTSDPTDHIYFPLTTGFAYYHMCVESSWEMVVSNSFTAAHQWLKKNDVDERSEWVNKCRNTTLTIGKIVAQTMIMRPAIWIVPAMTTPGKSEPIRERESGTAVAKKAGLVIPPLRSNAPTITMGAVIKAMVVRLG